ncbi:MAG: hypothetical protein K2H07_06555 [Lachnospiraceae bacterium]|nr:hypothetical protein [Lachnospiraceae bacterium]
MGKGKHLKKISLYFVLSMVLAASLTGCERKVKLKSDRFSEWVDAIGINEYPHVSCCEYYEYANGLELHIRPFNYETADDFKKIIDNHNAFVTRNPDYFPEDFDITITFRKGSQYLPLSFSNRTDSDLDKGTGEYMDLSAIETEKTHRMRYAYSYGSDDRIKTKFEAETIIISIGTYMDGVEKAHDESEDFENFDTIVVKIPLEVEREINVEEALEKIQRANPDAEIYYKTYSNELRKYVLDENSK